MAEDEKLLKESKKLSWEDRLAHKNWKVRVDANTDLAALCDVIVDPKDARLKDFGPLFRKSLADANAPAQEKALDALISFLRAADADAVRYAKEICDVVVLKCLTGRPKTVEKAQAIFLLWVELEAPDAFLDAMEKGIKNKVAKAVVPAIDAMYQAMSQFGSKVVPPKKILKMLPELFDHQDQHVRAAAKGLTIELCRWIGKEPVKSILLDKMRDTMRKELEVEMENVTGVPKPSRRIRSEQVRGFEQEVITQDAPEGLVGEIAPSGVQDIDEYDLMDPVDILGPLGKSGFWEGVKATKWSERRDAVAELTRLASAKRLAGGDYAEVSRVLKKLITDVNIAVGVEAVQAAGNLARGLRKDFGGGSRLLLPVLLDKLKEKKQVIVDALTQTLQAIHKCGCLSLADIVEDVRTATKNKVPSVRSLCLTWVAYCVETSSKANVLKLYKDYVPMLLESLNDGTPEVRDAAFSAIAAIAKLVGMKPLEKSLEKLDDVRKKKLAEMIGFGGSAILPVPVAGATRQAHGLSSEGSSDNIFIKPVGTSAASLLSNKKTASHSQNIKKAVHSSSKASAVKEDNGRRHVASEASDLVQFGENNLEELEGRVRELLEADVIVMLKSSVWKERLEGMTLFKDVIEKTDSLGSNTEGLIGYLSLIPGWKEKNVQVQQKVIEVLMDIVQKAGSVSKRAVFTCLAGVVEKVSDVKTRAQATQCLTVFCEAVGANFVIQQVLKIMKDHKNPKVQSEGLIWLVKTIEDFGVKTLPMKDLIDFCKDIGLQSSSAPVRNAAIKVFGILHKFIGPDIKPFLSDVKPALQTILSSEYERNPFDGTAPIPTKSSRAETNGDSNSSMESSLPREDISGKISGVLIKNMSSIDWKIRQEAIEQVNRILEEAHMRIQPAGTGELLGALKGRLTDSNKNLVMCTLATLGSVGSAMGPVFEKNSKGIITDALKCLGDNKKLMRETVLKTLDSWLLALHVEKMVPYLVPALVDSKICADGRKDLFDWLGKNLSKQLAPADLQLMMKPIPVALQDKSADVRKAAENFLVALISTFGHNLVLKIVRALPASAVSTLQPLLDRQKSSVAESVGQVAAAARALPAKVIVSDKVPTRSAIPRSSALRPATMKVSRQDAVVAAQDAAVQGQSLFNLKDCNKEEREKAVSRKIKFEEPRAEHLIELEVDLMKYFREDLYRRLLSSDFKKQLEGVNMLQKAIPSHLNEQTRLLDILLRWTYFRLCESNTTSLLKVLEFLFELVTALKNSGYILTEYEAGIIFPCLVEKSGHNIEKVREKIRHLTRLLCCLYPSSKILAFIAEGIRSKNNRTRVECVEHVGFMMESYGVEVTFSTKMLQIIVPLTTERDGDIRKSSISTLSVAHSIMGDEIWRYTGKLSDAHKSLLHEKFKWKARDVVKSKDNTTTDSGIPFRQSVVENGLNYEKTITNSGAFDLPIDGSLSAQSFSSVDWRDAISIIESGSNSEQVVESMKVVCYELAQVGGDMDRTSAHDLARSADRLVLSLTGRVTMTFNAGLSGSSSRSCKYVLNTLMQTFQVKKLAGEVKADTLLAVITELLVWLLDERVPLLVDGSQLLKALNVLMLKILENANRTSAFIALIDLLKPLAGDSSTRVVLQSQKFSDLVVKCLIKLTKVLNSTISEVELDCLLRSIHEYFQQLGLEEIRRRAGADDKPLRMVKTLLHELVKLCGTAIKGHLSMVPIDLEPQPIILAYIDLNLQTLAAARMLAPSVAGSQSLWPDMTTHGPSSPSNHSAELQLKQELAAIFKKIGDKQTCSIGLYELYRITQLYPQVDIFSQLQNASMAFRTYIRDGLSQMEKNSASGRIPNSGSFVTPPPLSLTTQESRQSTKNVLTFNHIKESCTDHTNRQDVTVEAGTFGRALEPLDCKPVSGAQSMTSDLVADSQGTLDAIRERMKNIQAAAAGTQGSSDTISLTTFQPVSDSLQHFSLGPSDDKALSGLQARMERLKNGLIDPTL